MAKNPQHGKTFEKDILATFRSMGHWTERFRDNTWNNGAGSNQSPPDLITIQHGRPMLMELKAVTSGHHVGVPRDISLASIGVKRCQGHQLQRLIDFEKGGHGEAFVLVMFYTPNAKQRCAVQIPVGFWLSIEKKYGKLSVRLQELREVLPPHLHLKWMGRKAEIGPYDYCRHLGEHPVQDIPNQDTRTI